MAIDLICIGSRVVSIFFFTYIHVQRRHENPQALEQVAGTRTTSLDGRLAFAEVHEQPKTIFQIIHFVFVPIAGELTFPNQLVGQPSGQTIFDHPFSRSRSVTL